MQISFLSVFITVLFLVLLAVPGFILAKTKLFKEGADHAISSIVLYVSQPMLIFMAFQKASYTPQIGINMLIVAGLAFLIHFIMIGLVFLCFRNKDNNQKIRALRFSSVFSNCGFMGLPFLSALFQGSTELQGEVLIYGGVVIAVFNLLTWSIGVFIMTGDKKQINVKNALLNPTVISMILGLILFFSIQKPLFSLAGTEGDLAFFLDKFKNALTFLAEMTTPLSAMAIGIKLSKVKPKELLLDKWAYVSSVNKLIIMSIVSMLIVAFLPIASVVKYVVFFLLSMPSATSSVLFAVQFGGDAKSASVNVLLSTVFCIVTIPLMFLLFSQCFGVPIVEC